jgi:hypothetical protein
MIALQEAIVRPTHSSLRSRLVSKRGPSAGLSPGRLHKPRTTVSPQEARVQVNF